MSAAFVKICALSEIPEGKAKAKSINGHNIILVRHEDSVYALDNVCSHDGGELDDGAVIDGQVECPRHGARFNVKTGDVTRMPAAVGLGIYPAKIEHGEVYVMI
jgi:3-phenylpropionate/trans-cinnamate dioxygenase ferredoxin subunit